MAGRRHANGNRPNEVEGTDIAEPKEATEGEISLSQKLHCVDSLHLEAGRVSNSQTHSAKAGWGTILHLAFQSIGVVYGDIGTSPLYVYSSTFTDGIKDTDDLLGVLSLIIYTLTLIPLLKYVFIVLWANDNGDGGTFALYSLISRYAKVSLVPNQQAEDAMLSNYKLEIPSKQMKRANWIKGKLESSTGAKVTLFLVTILATSMVIGDGVLTPCISVLSAVTGIKESAKSLTEGTIAGISIVILILLFAVQRFGTDKVGYSFAPIILLWFSLIGGIGVYNLIKHDVGVLRAFNPKYIIDYFKRNGKQGWVSLGGVILCITGTEAMFADLGHFNVRAIQIGFSAILLPSVLLAYIGQAAYLTKFPDEVADTFYKSIPGSLYWPTFVVAVAAAIIASQAMISGAFAIISQSQKLGCFPRVRIVHTSSKYEGQVYIPEINYALMIACVALTAIFKTTEKIGNAYGIAVVFVMFITTLMVTVIMLFIWKTSMLLIALFFIVFGGIELLYLSSTLYKFTEGGFLPLALSLILMAIMGIWHYVHVERYTYELKNKVSSSYIRDLVQRYDLIRIPGIGLLYSELVQGIPPLLPHLIEKIPSLHSVLVIISVKYLPISKVEIQERFLFRHVEPREYKIFRCVVRYGYKDAPEESLEFERSLIEQLKVFIRQENFFQEFEPAEQTCLQEAASPGSSTLETGDLKIEKLGSSTMHTRETLQQQTQLLDCSKSMCHGITNHSTNSSGQVTAAPTPGVAEEVQFIQKEMSKGVVYLIGETEVVAKRNSNIIRKFVVDYVYDFMRRNFRQGEKVMSIPHSRLLRVGMTYEI